jgi:nucleotide-binding universal stress UspA family protein
MTESGAAGTGAGLRVVVGLDASDQAACAARWAAGEAVARDVSLSLLHALGPSHKAVTLAPHAADRAEHRRADGEKLLERTERTLHREFPGLRTDTELDDDSAIHALSALSIGAGLIVTGSRGHGRVTGMLLGSVSHRLAAHSHCPLVIVRAAQGPETRNEVVLGVEDDHTEAATHFAFAAAERYGATLHAVSCWYPRTGYYGQTGMHYGEVDDVRDDVRRTVEVLLEEYRSAHPGVPVEITPSRANPVPALVEAANRARLLVIGAHRHEGSPAIGNGHVVDGVLAQSATPVAVVPIH